jgi:hypothetical protein
MRVRIGLRCERISPRRLYPELVAVVKVMVGSASVVELSRISDVGAECFRICLGIHQCLHGVLPSALIDHYSVYRGVAGLLVGISNLPRASPSLL